MKQAAEDIDAWLQRTSLGLRSVLNAWSRRLTGLSFPGLVRANPRLAVNIVYQALGDHLGEAVASIILEHVTERYRDDEEEGSEGSVGGSIHNHSALFSLTF